MRWRTTDESRACKPGTPQRGRGDGDGRTTGLRPVLGQPGYDPPTALRYFGHSTTLLRRVSRSRRTPKTGPPRSSLSRCADRTDGLAVQSNIAPEKNEGGAENGSALLAAFRRSLDYLTFEASRPGRFSAQTRAPGRGIKVRLPTFLTGS